MMHPIIPDCYDPIYQAEQRETEWDRFVEKLPVCILCKSRIFPGNKIHTVHRKGVCASCVEELNDNYEFVEEPE